MKLKGSNLKTGAKRLAWSRRVYAYLVGKPNIPLTPQWPRHLALLWILIASHLCVVSFHPCEPLVQVRTQLDKGNTSVSERYKTRLLEPEEVTHCQNFTFRHLGTGSMLGNFHAVVIPAPSQRRFFLLKMEFFAQSPLHTEFFVTGITLVEEEYLPNIANEFYDWSLRLLSSQNWRKTNVFPPF